MDKKKSMYVDLTEVLAGGRIAVRCRSLFETRVLEANLKDQCTPRSLIWTYPFCSNWKRNFKDDTCFSIERYENKPYGETGNFPIPNYSFCFCDTDWYVRNGYRVFEMTDLINDSSDISEVDADLTALL